MGIGQRGLCIDFNLGGLVQEYFSLKEGSIRSPVDVSPLFRG